MADIEKTDLEANRPPLWDKTRNSSEIAQCASGILPDVSGKTLEQRVQDLEDINAIRNLKYAYWDALDTHDLERLAMCFSEDARFEFPAFGVAVQGREAVANQAGGSLTAEIISCHQGHQHYIEKTGENTAQGTANLRDDLVNVYKGTEFKGRAYYDEEYVKVDGRWYIDHMQLRYNMSDSQYHKEFGENCGSSLGVVF